MDERAQMAIAWASDILKQPPQGIEAIGSDASHRRYFRFRGDKQSWIIMDAPPDLEPLGPFMDVQQRLCEAKLNVPIIHGSDVKHGWLLLSDLGSTSYRAALNDNTADRLFADAQAALSTMQTEVRQEGLAAYDAAHLLRELNLFTDWFLSAHWGVEPSDEELDQWDEICALVIRWALDQPQVFCHRDYMPRNLMVSTPNPGILDFQDAVIGPITYDLISLYLDAFISWPRARVDAWLEHYRKKAIDVGLDATKDPKLWLKMCDLMAVQRHLKVIGIFARIAYRDGKPAYLEDTPRFFAYLDHALATYPELGPLAGLIHRWSARRVRQHPGGG